MNPEKKSFMQRTGEALGRHKKAAALAAGMAIGAAHANEAYADRLDFRGDPTAEQPIQSPGLADIDAKKPKITVDPGEPLTVTPPTTNPVETPSEQPPLDQKPTPPPAPPVEKK